MPDRQVTYDGRCHCGAVRFRLRAEPITAGLRCNCSICVRKGAVMSLGYFPPDAFESLDGLAKLRCYQWGDLDVNHWFCPTCGIYPFHDLTRAPGAYRVNLGCLDGLDVLSLPVTVFDGRSL